jgi:uncharacterized membrane protein (DUF485 family)
MNSQPPAPATVDDHPEISAANARAGLVLFFIYLAFYAGFMGLAAFAPQAMGRPVLAGVNLAITYGMALIVGALVIAALYMAACSHNARRYGEREALASRNRSEQEIASLQSNVTGRLTPAARQDDGAEDRS